MVWVVGNGEALGAGVGGNCSSGMDGSKTITRRYPGRGNVYYSGGFRYQMGRLSKKMLVKIKKSKKGGCIPRRYPIIHNNEAWMFDGRRSQMA